MTSGGGPQPLPVIPLDRFQQVGPAPGARSHRVPGPSHRAATALPRTSAPLQMKEIPL